MVDDNKDTTLTPLWLVERLGVFDLDPCAFAGHATAKRLIVLPQDGLSAAWDGRVWLNPPYSEPDHWLERLARHGNGIALVLSSTDTRWFHDFIAAFASAVLFIKGRPQFLRDDKTEVGLMRATMLAAFGDENAVALFQSGIDGWFAPNPCRPRKSIQLGWEAMWTKPFDHPELV